MWPWEDGWPETTWKLNPPPWNLRQRATRQSCPGVSYPTALSSSSTPSSQASCLVRTCVWTIQGWDRSPLLGVGKGLPPTSLAPQGDPSSTAAVPATGCSETSSPTSRPDSAAAPGTHLSLVSSWCKRLTRVPGPGKQPETLLTSCPLSLSFLFSPPPSFLPSFLPSCCWTQESCQRASVIWASGLFDHLPLAENCR